MPRDWKAVLSLRAYGARHQMWVALTLVAVIPLLAFGFVTVSATWPGQAYSVWIQFTISLLALVIGLSGFLMLRRYPQHIENLKDHLRGMAEGELPPEVQLRDDMDDVAAIARYLNMILVEMRHKVKQLEQQLALSRRLQKTVEEQAQQLVEAERHRVMLESLGAACHHIGQPATVLRLYLDSMARSGLGAEDKQKIQECRQAMETISDILNRLRNLSEYRTVPYQDQPVNGTASETRILDIG